jgi:hypothetical protein
MERAILWLKCAAMHDPVRPVLKRPAIVGWEAQRRQVDLTIERPFKGDELLKRMKGWVTADVDEVIEIISRYGQLKILDDYNLVVETNDMAAMTTLSENLNKIFNQEVWLEILQKKHLS